MFWSTGKLQYGLDNYNLPKLILNVDQSITNYYSSLIPKYYNVQPQKYKAHISVVRKIIPTFEKMQYWGKYEGVLVDFSYDGLIFSDKQYFWINCWSPILTNIREELGLPLKEMFHITIANIKKKQM